MIRLFIDTSSDYLSILLSSDKGVLASLRLLAGRRMSELILAQVDNVVRSANIDPSAIDEYYCIVGPGSFTGVRIGVAMVLGLSEGCSKPAFGLTSLDAAALSSGRQEVSVVSRLKGDLYAFKSYDFINNIFSDYECCEIAEDDLLGYLIVNSAGGSSVILDSAISDDRYLMFKTDCVPLYLRKSEAEINIENNERDNKSRT